MNRLLPLLILGALPVIGAELSIVTPGDRALLNYFRNETSLISERCLADIKTLEDWKAGREEYRRQLAEMLGLWPSPERTDLKPVITGRLEQEDFVAEKLHFQPVPHLYVTGTLFLPKQQTNPLPAILLESGHARVFTNNISYGNKAVYQNLGAWFARNGYVCLNLDTLSLGEIQGIHTGTRDRGQWWWNSRGYTPAGIEAWTGIRGLDYLCTRSEVDTNRIAICGHSGGGAYSWTVSALDERVKAVAPIAGLTDMQNQVVDGLLDSHCDCNFYINTYRWDFPQMAALVAPRPLLIGTTDKDGLFPVNGTLRLHQHVRRIYELYKEPNKLGLVITPGPHEWNVEAQVAVLRWFNRNLKGEDPRIETAAKPFFTAQQLKVFEELPTDAINTNIQETFVPAGKLATLGEFQSQRDKLVTTLREKSFAGWPSDDLPLEPRQVFAVEREGVKFSAWDFSSQHDVTLRIYFFEPAKAPANAPARLDVLNQKDWGTWLGMMRSQFDAKLKEETTGTGITINDPVAFDVLRQKLVSQGAVQAFIAPRGIGLTAWSGNEKVQTRIRRRFMLLGQTLDGMRVWDIRRAVQMIHFIREGDSARVELHASGAMAINAAYAALFEPGVRKLDMADWPESPDDHPDYLNAWRTVHLAPKLALPK